MIGHRLRKIPIRDGSQGIPQEQQMNIDDSPSGKLKMLAQQAHDFGKLKLDDPSSMTEFSDKASRVFPHLALAARELPGETYGHLMHVAQMSYSWGQCGRPAYQLTHGLAAALMLTDPPPMQPGERLELPARTFCIMLPEGIVPVFNKGVQGWADLIWVNASKNVHVESGQEEEFFRWLVEWRSVSVWRDRKPEHLYDEEDERKLEIEGAELVAEDDLCLWSGLKLVRNLCSWLQATDALQNYKRPVAKKRKKSKHKAPKARVYQLGREVKVSPELREMASEIALGKSKHAREGWKLRAQHLVRGHWRNQAHGPQRSLRKLIWIEPHTRGPSGEEAWGEVLG
jgi:hypothetical protein